VLNIAAAVVIPRTSLGYAGFFGQKNELGAVTALGLLTFAMTFLGKSKMDRIAATIGLPLAVFLLVYSRSKTSFILGIGVPMLVYGICFASRALRMRPGFIIGSGVVFSLLTFSVAFGAGFGYQDLLKLFFHDATFTGRTEIWSFAWSNIMTRPLAGFGFNGFWGVGGGSAATSADNAFIANILQSHNGYLDTLLEEGFVGLTILACFIVVTLGHSGRLIRSDVAGGAFCLAVALFFALHNFEESSAFRRFEPTWVLFLVSAAAAARPARRRSVAAWQPAWVGAC
jgi:exopolysaccharide production protein ExoQ